MLHDLKILPVAIRVLGILKTEYQHGTLRLQVHAQCWKDRRFHGVSVIDCSNVYDYCIRTPDPNTIVGGPVMEVTSHHPLLWINQPFCYLKITAAEDLARWTGPTAEAAMAALFAHHRQAVGEFIPFDAALYFRQGPRGLSVGGPKQLMEGYATVLKGLGFHPQVEQMDPHGQAIPGGDGDIYDPPLDLHLLLMDRSWVIAEAFHITEVMPEPKHPPVANQN